MEQNDHSTTTEIVVSADFTETEKALQVAEHKHKDIVHDVTTKQGMKAAKADVSELRTMRTTVDKKRLEVGRVLLAEKAKIDDKAKAIIARISALEEPLKLQVEAEEARVEAERLAVLEAERVRVETILAKIAAFRELPGKVAGWPSSRIAAELTKVQAATVTEDEYQEHTAQAQDAHAACVARLQTMYADAQAREAEAERTRKLEAEHAAQQAELEALRRDKQEAQEREERRLREEKERAEARETLRVANIRHQIEMMASLAAADWRAGIDNLKDRLDELDALDPALGNFLFEEFGKEASETYLSARESLTSALDEAVAKDAEQKAEREAQERRAQDAEKARKEAEAKAAKARQDAEKARAAEKAAKLASIGLRDAVVESLQWFSNNGVTDMAEKMSAALANDDKAMKA